MSSELQSGKKLCGGKYTIVRKLGQGSFGITYQATMRTTVTGSLGSFEGIDINVAIKEFYMREFNSRGADNSTVEGSQSNIVQNYRRKFRREAENLSRMKHESIVKVLDLFDENGTTYYVMQYLEGESLDGYIGKKGHLPEDESIDILCQIGSALQYMHENHMLHLDMKPGNVMFSHGRAVLIDFGLSKQYDDNGEPESSTTLGLGTRGYAPIELSGYIQDGSFPATLDVYALGATLFKMLCGQRPPDASELLTPDAFPVSYFTTLGVSDNTVAAMRCAMALNKADRFQTVSAFVDALKSASGTCRHSGEETVLSHDYCDDTSIDNRNAKPHPSSVVSEDEPVKTLQKEKKNNWLVVSLITVIVLLIAYVIGINKSNHSEEEFLVDTPKENHTPNTVNHPDIMTITVGDVKFDMIKVEAGSFDMGCIDEGEDCENDEWPYHKVIISEDYYIGKFEVTQELYEAVMGVNPSKWLSIDRPVDNVSWIDAYEFCSKLSSMTGYNFTLPTEAEWEYAARGGHKATVTKYSGSSNVNDVAWCSGHGGDGSHPVGRLYPNELGIYDMSGNVWEWCLDWYGEYSSSTQTDPKGPSTGTDRVFRGGSWGSLAKYCRVVNRGFYKPAVRSHNYGFRVVIH